MGESIWYRARSRQDQCWIGRAANIDRQDRSGTGGCGEIGQEVVGRRPTLEDIWLSQFNSGAADAISLSYYCRRSSDRIHNIHRSKTISCHPFQALVLSLHRLLGIPLVPLQPILSISFPATQERAQQQQKLSINLKPSNHKGYLGVSAVEEHRP